MTPAEIANKSCRASNFGALLFCCLLAAGCFGPGDDPVAGIYRVRHVIDGDTVVLEGGGKVRLIGINAPELGHDGEADEPLARLARTALRELIGGKPVQLVDGAEAHDRHGRRLAHLESADGVNVQQALLWQGLAAVVVFPPNLRNRERYLQVEIEARAAGRGIWDHPYFKPREIDALPGGETGFRFVTGEVEKITKSRRYITLWLSPHFALLIGRGEWKAFWSGRPSQYAGQRVVARGWLFKVGAGRRMRIRHPDMLNVPQ
ncbi:MAG: thermonuclease family protein [Pseudomonadota bacterium]|nr:thermonuclease family protein [Pseudomonadota bacterium]